MRRFGARRSLSSAGTKASGPVPPPAPAYMFVIPQDISSIEVTFEVSFTASTYVEQSTDNTNWTLVGIAPLATGYVVSSGLTRNQVYYYRIRRLKNGVYSSYFYGPVGQNFTWPVDTQAINRANIIGLPYYIDELNNSDLLFAYMNSLGLFANLGMFCIFSPWGCSQGNDAAVLYDEINGTSFINYGGDTSNGWTCNFNAYIDTQQAPGSWGANVGSQFMMTANLNNAVSTGFNLIRNTIAGMEDTGSKIQFSFVPVSGVDKIAVETGFALGGNVSADPVTMMDEHFVGCGFDWDVATSVAVVAKDPGSILAGTGAFNPTWPANTNLFIGALNVNNGGTQENGSFNMNWFTLSLDYQFTQYQNFYYALNYWNSLVGR